MTPKLIAIAGPLKATIFPLDADETTVGRDPCNLISLNDLSVSRRHCVVRREAGRCTIVDLDSHNGVFVNDVPARERALEHGDRIKVGNSLFLFLTEELEAVPVRGEVQFEETTLIGEGALRFRVEDALYHMASDLGSLMKFSLHINAARGLEEVRRETLEQILQILPAERGAVLLTGRGEHAENFDSVYAAAGDSGTGATMYVSRTAVSQVLESGLALLSNGIQRGDALAASQSLMSSSVSSLLCVPLKISDRVLGVIYLDTSAPAVGFDEGHLRMAMAVANIAAGALANASYVEWLEGENRRLQADLHLEHDMVGESPCMREVYELVAKLAAAKSTILIRGESGTGKELAARALHRNGPRRERPFVAVNCAALTEPLLESELFGHERGAFTGAVAQKRGKLEVADGGTLFLDEVGEMSPAVQTKLLRVIQERSFERLGGTRTIKADVRFVAATNRDLEEAIRRGDFREDLFYRLNVISFEMPPLRERREDIPLLTNHFVARYARECKRRVAGISPAARTRLVSYDWPGNVRELENAIEHAVVLCSTDIIMPEDLPEFLLEGKTPQDSPLLKYYEAVKEAKRQIIVEAFGQAGGDFAEAARLLGIHPNNLHRLIRNLNLRGEVQALKRTSAQPLDEV